MDSFILDDLQKIGEKACDKLGFNPYIHDNLIASNLVSSQMVGGPLFFHYLKAHNRIMSLLCDPALSQVGQKTSIIPDNENIINQGWLKGLMLVEDDEALSGVRLGYKDKDEDDYPYSSYILSALIIKAIRKCEKMTNSSNKGDFNLVKIFEYGTFLDNSLSKVQTLPEFISFMATKDNIEASIIKGVGFDNMDMSSVEPEILSKDKVKTEGFYVK